MIDGRPADVAHLGLQRPGEPRGPTPVLPCPRGRDSQDLSRAFRMSDHGDSIDGSEFSRIVAACDRYENEWRAGGAPRIEAFVDGVAARCRRPSSANCS